jgi:formylglycine-generating enzyme required for sulfatase activity
MQKHFIDEITSMRLLFIPGGNFSMGDGFGDGFPDERPLREVRVDDFWLGECPVTQGQWRRVMNGNPAMFKKGAEYPVEMISWDQSMEFIKRLNTMSKHNFRLPTEAEWEYAARGGGKLEKWSGVNDISQAGDFMWFEDNAESRTHPVGEKKPNRLGLYDMSGLTHEWNIDIYHPDAYTFLGEDNPVCERPGAYRVFRGGSWKRHLEGLRCTRRMGGLPNLGFGTFGIRLAKSV